MSDEVDEILKNADKRAKDFQSSVMQQQNDLDDINAEFNDTASNQKIAEQMKKSSADADKIMGEYVPITDNVNPRNAGQGEVSHNEKKRIFVEEFINCEMDVLLSQPIKSVSKEGKTSVRYRYTEEEKAEMQPLIDEIDNIRKNSKKLLGKVKNVFNHGKDDKERIDAITKKMNDKLQVIHENHRKSYIRCKEVRDALMQRIEKEASPEDIAKLRSIFGKYLEQCTSQKVESAEQLKQMMQMSTEDRIKASIDGRKDMDYYKKTGECYDLIGQEEELKNALRKIVEMQITRAGKKHEYEEPSVGGTKGISKQIVPTLSEVDKMDYEQNYFEVLKNRNLNKEKDEDEKARNSLMDSLY